MEPSVKILYSESPLECFNTGTVLSLGAANRIFEQRDIDCEDTNTIENIVYEISYDIDGSSYKYCCSQNFGDGDGSVINHIRKNALEALHLLNNSGHIGPVCGKKNPFTTLQKSYSDMLDRILPELEAYCLAFKTYDVLVSFDVDNCDAILLSGVKNITPIIKNSTQFFISLLDDIISKNPGNLSLINSIDVLIVNAQQYLQLVNKHSLESLLTEATQKATRINADSRIDFEEPCINPELICFEL